MTIWLNALTTLMKQPTAANPAILITVAQVEGSGPRAPGAKMVVTSLAQFDTIGGGHLELCAIDIARQMLNEKSVGLSGSNLAGERRLQRFSLGPSLGQCCGGVVHLAFERVDANAAEYFNYLQLRLRKAEDSWRLVALDCADTAIAPSLCDADGRRLHGPGMLPTLPTLIDSAMVIRDAAGQRWLLDGCLAPRPQLFLFGAGHVGAAIVRALSDLPCRITWIDEREEMFPDLQPANVTIEATDIPEALVASAPPGVSFLVMTHNHALDQRLSELILQRDDIGWFGLIGSKTKRMQFEHRLQERGIAPERFAAMICPIGIQGIVGKEPAVIAASVTAQLLQVWERMASTSPVLPSRSSATAASLAANEEASIATGG
ncbi:xanthine dehydrogenase accessory protein XdhC [Glaciimonas immobilis]|uniref:Xanthine dehydrogenase accessory factor n=1 Tax=Glaciimonas immobilis TaxID=728004 RepID=A0A840RST1_9BURK|nr:xanthine dehydrogenase accessory protein XdhC [Glaciimonas immobilis]KAF3997148.1 xanthine dehydrogenase accessory protein XdhC [Glaciimonas immobilis]MBB5200016.1 xanthine dehydrogenase accessory factor [Glaciimonas immobilis]